MSLGKVLIVAAFCAITTIGNAFAAIQIFTDSTSFDAAVSGLDVIFDDLSTDIAPADEIVLSSGIISTNNGGNRSGFFIDNRVNANEYNNTVDASGMQASTSITLTLPTPVTAFGFNSTRVNPNSLQISFFSGADTETFFVRENGRLGNFFGVMSDVPFQEVVLSSIGIDNFDIIDFTFGSLAAPTPSEVPLPAAAWLFLAAIGGGLGLNRRGKLTQS